MRVPGALDLGFRGLGLRVFGGGMGFGGLWFWSYESEVQGVQFGVSF